MKSDHSFFYKVTTVKSSDTNNIQNPQISYQFENLIINKPTTRKLSL